MRANKIRTAGLLLGFGLGAFLEGVLMHPVVGTFYIFVWAISVGGVLTLWSAIRGPGPLPSGRVLIAFALIGWGVFNMLEGIASHDLRTDWLVFASGLGFALLGVLLIRLREEYFIERRAGYDRRSGSPFR
ncbi:MAG TPA: DUF2243 domain-containing protein [Burkholderiales bacterium]|nr:DUF2243 domain-containing protein [Burkholderiales bacterium]